MAESIASLNLMIRASAENLAADINSGISRAQSSVQTRAVALGTVLGAGITAGATAALAGIKSAITAAFDGLDRIDAMDEMASKTGIAYNAMVDLGYAAKTTGSSAESMSASLIKMQQGLANGKAGEAMAKLKLDIAEVRKLQPEAQFAAIAERLRQINDNGSKLDLTKQIFGKGGTDIMNVINLGKAGLTEINALVQQMGGHLSDAQVIMAGMANDSLDQLSGQFGFLKDQIAVGIAPALTQVVKLIQEFVRTFNADGGGISGKIQEWAAGAVNFAASLATVAQGADAAFSVIKAGGLAVNVVFQTIGGVITGMGVSAVSAAKVVQDAMKLAADNVGLAFKTITLSIANAILDSMNGLKNGVIKTLHDIEMQADLAAIKLAKAITPFAGTKFDAPIQAGENAIKNDHFRPSDVLPDTPTGFQPGGPGALLFPGGPGQLADDLAKADAQAKQLGMDIDLFKSTATEGMAGIGVLAQEQFTLAESAAAEAAGKMKALTNGSTWGDDMRNKVDQIKKGAAEIADVRNLDRNKANAARLIDLEQERAAAGERVAITTAAEQAKLDAARTAAEQHKEIQKSYEDTYRQLQNTTEQATTSMVTSWITGTGKISDIVSQWANQMIQQFVQVSLFGTKAGGGGLFGSFMNSGVSSGGSGIGAWASLLGGIFGGGTYDTAIPGLGYGGTYASGGRPPMGKVSVVGERGPELFVPDSVGRIIPNHKLGSTMASVGGTRGGGGTSTNVESPIIINQSFSSGVTRAELAGAMDEMIDQTRGAVVTAISRGGSYRRKVQS